MRCLCGIRPTGDLHIGHYFAVIEPGIRGADVLIAEFHAPRVHTDQLLSVINTLKRFKVQNIVRQCEIFDPRFYFRVLDITGMGELARMTQYRESKKPNAHLFCYPVLMACDVAGYEEVIVGEDQRQHLNFARDLLVRYNKIYGERIGIPAAKPEAGRVLSLTNPTKKMSKSEPAGCLFLNDAEDAVRKKIKRAVTTEVGRNNLLSLYRRLGGKDNPVQNVNLKEALTERILGLMCTTLP